MAMSNEINNFAAHSGTPDPIDELQLIRYLDGRLEGAQKQEVEDLLRTNAAVRRRLDALREEERLLREALETLSEPSKRLSDKVISTLHTEERFRLQAIRNKRLRRNLVWGLGVAASFVLCVWLMKPRDSMGSAVAGTGGTVVLPTGERRPFGKNNSFYEKDQIVTAAGQFLRLRVSNEAQIDLDERSKLVVEKNKPEPAFRLESGRLGLQTAQQDVIVRLPQGMIRVTAGSVVDVWLPLVAKAEWPEWLMTPPMLGTASAKARGDNGLPAIVTVISGSVSANNDVVSGEGVQTTQGNRLPLYKNQTPVAKSVDLTSSRVIETRRGNSWHGADVAASASTGPQDRALIGLFDKPDFKELGQRLGMTKNTPEAVATALNQLQDGMMTGDPLARAEKLAAGQQALRAAYEPLASDDERRDFGRMLEGLAHLERGRSLMMKQSPDRVAAHAAFDAARVAFEEAIRQDGTPDTKPDWARQIAAGTSVTLRELSATNQSAVLAAYNHAVAQVWLMVDEPATKVRGAEAAKEFESLRSDLSKAVEGMAARLAHGMILQSSGKNEKAIEAYAEVLAVPMAGWSDSTRRYGDGLKQASLEAMAKLYRQMQQIDKLRMTQRDFAILYPLDEASPVAQDLRREYSAGLEELGDREQLAGRYEAAIDAYSDSFSARQPEEPAALYLKVLKAAVSGKDREQANAAVLKLEAKAKAGELNDAQKTEFEKLDAQAKTLPAAAPRANDGIKGL
jgi:hypothetical protein